VIPDKNVEAAQPVEEQGPSVAKPRPPQPAAPPPPTLDDLRRLAPTPIAHGIAAAFGPGQPSERFDATMALMEGIAARACQLLNSLYLHSARDLGVGGAAPIEQRLMELGRKPLSFGDYVSAMELFLVKLWPALLHGDVKPRWAAFADPLRESLALGKEIAALEQIKKARVKYGIPVAHLEAYLDDQKGSTAKAVTMKSVLDQAIIYRNARAHHHAWFLDDEAWYQLLASRFRTILERVMLHPPIYRLLTEIEVVTTRAVGRMTAPGQHLWDAARIELDGLRRPLGESKLASPMPLAAGSYWARRPHDEQAPLQWLCPARTFPENVETEAQREQRYRARVLTAYLETGTLRASDIDSTLSELGAQLGIEEKAAQQLEGLVVAAIRAAEAELRAKKDEGALGRLTALVQHPDVEIDHLNQALAALDRQRTAQIYAVIEEQWPMSQAALLRHSEMHPEDLERALEHLLDGAEPSKIIRRVEPAPDKVQYRIPSPRATEQLTTALDRVRAEPGSIAALRPLLEVCQQFFLDDGHPTLPDAIGLLLVDASPAASAPTGHEELFTVEVPGLLFAAGGQVVAAATVPALFREIVARFGTDPGLLAGVPFATGRLRFLVARDGLHRAGREFVNPLPFPEHGLIFEANQSRYSALKGLWQWFVAAGIPVERAEVEGLSID
jgi:hypothetical protein